MANNIYRGYSSYEYQKTRSFNLSDIQLVELDLLNHIFCRRGTRPKMRSFGTRIPDITFEPLTEDTIEIVREDLEYVVNYDPRVSLVDMTTTPVPANHVLNVVLKLFYIEFNVTLNTSLNIQFSQNS